MTDKELSQRIEHILRYHKVRYSHGRTFAGLQSVKRELARFIKANYEPKPAEGSNK